MRICRRGQSTLEYLAIGALVLGGILVIGPVVVRQINAHFQFLEDSIQDSYREKLEQAPPDPGVSLPTCDCTPMQPQSCGDGTTCSRYERLWTRTCAPVGCELGLSEFGLNVKLQECRFDDTCCDDWVWNGKCGQNASGNPNPDYEADGTCPDDTGEFFRKCGEGGHITEWKCAGPSEEADAVNCLYVCLGTKDSVASWCNPDYNKNLTGSMTITYVSAGSCTPGSKCQAECPSGLIPTPTGCSCGPFAVRVGNLCQCMSGYVYQGSCPSGQCSSEGCPPKQCKNTWAWGG